LFARALPDIWPREFCAWGRSMIFDDEECDLLLGDHTKKHSRSAQQRFCKRIDVLRAVGTLPIRYEKVIICRYYLGFTKAECSQVFGVSSTRIAQLERNALSKLRHPSRMHLLEAYYEGLV
jgi:DNA-directed RNA polymerase sigma subunit (sigma70/sigma32)